MLQCLAPNCSSNARGFQRACDQTRHINKCPEAKFYTAQQQKLAQKRKRDFSEAETSRAKKPRRSEEPIDNPVDTSDAELGFVTIDDPVSVNVEGMRTHVTPPPLILPPPRRRARRRPKTFSDVLPESTTGQLEDTPDNIHSSSESHPGQLPSTIAATASSGHGIWTLPNRFGIMRRYYSPPTSIPDGEKLMVDLIDDPDDVLRTMASMTAQTDAEEDSTDPGPASSAEAPDDSPRPSLLAKVLDIIHPHPHFSSFLMNRWFYRPGATNKSKMDRNLLVKEVILNPTFNPSDLAPPFNFETLDNLLVKSTNSSPDLDLPGTGWRQCDITIDIPPTGELSRTIWTTPGGWIRPIVQIIREVTEGPASRGFNWDGFEEWWKPGLTQPPQRVYHNIYTSDAYLRAEAELRETEPPGYTGAPRRILGLMFWSDATHLSDFGQASLHPIYMGFANQDKYDRCHPSKRGLHHIAYIPKLPNELWNFMTLRLGKPPTSEMVAHLRQEHFHAVWKLLLDDDFLAAHEQGILVTCGDKVQRHEYFRIMTYSTDYPERAAAGGIRQLGRHSCPKDHAEKQHLDLLGTSKSRKIINDRQRKDDASHRKLIADTRSLIYENGYAIRSTEIERRLSKASWVPTLNAFSEKIGPLNPPVTTFQMLVNDVMHEWEGGVVKRTISYLVRLLHAANGKLPALLDERYRDMPSFGSKLRRFPSNFSELKNLAARDHENALLCSTNAFCGLLSLVDPTLSSLQDTILDSIYVMSTFHSLSKLRMHTTATLGLLGDVTVALGTTLRRLRDESMKAISIKELSRDVQARVRNQNRRMQKQASKASAPPTQKKVITLNLNTIKNHLLEHYVDCIQTFGTTDGYSTSLGEREHCFSKARFQRTNKQRSRFVASLTREETIERRIGQMEEEIKQLQEEIFAKELGPQSSEMRAETVGKMVARYTIGGRSDNSLILPQWLAANSADPAITVFMRKLKDHVLRRLRQGTTRLDDDTTYSVEDHSGLLIRGDRLYEHKTIRINYTTYDVRREYDTVTSRHPDIMLLSNEDPETDCEDPVHPYWYARVLKTFHIFVSDTRGSSGREERMDILWVRWFGVAEDWVGGWKYKRMLRLGYVPGVEDGFGFVDPSEVIRGCFLLPVREFTRTKELLDPPSSLASDHSTEGDYRYYDLIHWVDRDMFMRYCGGGPGHYGIPTCATAWCLTLDAPSRSTAPDVQTHLQADVSSSESEDGEEGSEYEPDALDLLLEEEPTGNLDYGF